jgi:hypothetical protein
MLEEEKKKRTIKKDMREWESLATFTKGEDAVHDPEDITQGIYEAAKNFMEESGLIKLATHRAKASNLHLWKKSTGWHSDGNTTKTTIYHCPLMTKFGYPCQLKVTDMARAVYVEKRGVHDKECHSADKDQSKFLKLHQIEAIRAGVIIAPKQGATHLRRNLMHASPEKRIQPTLARSVERQVRKFRAKLTEAKLEGISVDDSYGSLVALADSKWFSTLLANHNDPDCDYHMDMYDPFIIGRDFNPGEDICT